MVSQMIIGGHEGMDVIRGDGVIVKRGRNMQNKHGTAWIDNLAALKNEARFLKLMSGSGFTPELIDEGEDFIVQTDLGDRQPMQDGELFRRNCVRLLHEIRRRGIRHGDLTGANLIIQNDWPWVVDWQEAHLIGEPAPQKQPFSDSHLLWRTVAGTVSAKTHTYDTPRVARRWLAVLGELGGMSWHKETMSLPLAGKTFVDLGCFQGDFVAAAAVEGMQALGVDRGGFRSGEDSLAIATELWRGLGCSFKNVDIMAMESFAFDVVLLFSTWSYIVQEYGRAPAEELLGRIVSQCGVLFFENQLIGDGPGPAFLQTEEDVGRLLGRFGAAEQLITVPVWGRPASRTVWSVRRR